MGSITFSHDYVGSLAIDNGIDDAQWSYNLNTANFPTYGGEVVQILSVYIDDLTLTGTCATYAQIEAIYSFFSAYFQAAAQGHNPSPGIGDSTTAGAYNLTPMTFGYAERNWSFAIYPKSAPGFRYGQQVVTPTWSLSSHVVDDTPDLKLIKEGIKALADANLPGGSQVFNGIDLNTFKLTGEISPRSGNPDTNPFETYVDTTGAEKNLAGQIIGQYGTYYSNLLNAYNNDDFSSLLGTGSSPAPRTQSNPNAPSAGGSVSQAGAGLSSGGSPTTGLGNRG